jgi:hypothetical protein
MGERRCSWWSGSRRGRARVASLIAVAGGLVLVAAAISGAPRVTQAPRHGVLTARTVAQAADAAASCTPGSPEQNLPANGFICPVQIPGSAGLGEPSIVHDSQGRLFVTAPQGLGNVHTAGGSPLFTSTNGGLSWGAPVRSQACAGLSGGDTDLAVDGGGNVYQTDLWLGSSCLSVSTDHGQSFAAGNPFGSELQPGDDRPWLAYNSISNQMYIAYDGFDALHVANTAPLASPLLGIQAIQDIPAVPESAVNSGSVPDAIRQCVCPPGGIAVDNSTGPHSGRVYVSYSYQHGTAISFADLVGVAPVRTAGTWSAPIAIPGSGSSGSAFGNEWNFDPIAVDANGTVYVAWGHANGFNSGTNVAANGVEIDYAYSKDGGSTWSGPFKLSTEGGTATFPTMSVAGNGVLDFAWYGDPAHAVDPNLDTGGQWNLYYARVTAADTATPSISPVIAVTDMHNGCIQTGGGASCSDRSLLDFFQVTDVSGHPALIYTAGDVTAGVNLWFTRLPLRHHHGPAIVGSTARG